MIPPARVPYEFAPPLVESATTVALASVGVEHQRAVASGCR